MTKDRAQSPEIVVFGRRPVFEALGRAADVEVHRVLVARDLPADLRKRLRAACRERDVTLEEVDVREVGAASGEPRHDQGLVAEVRLLNVAPVEALVADARGEGRLLPRRVLALDDVTNSQNIGMIARSAVAAGMHGLLWPMHGCPWINGLVVKSSAATVFRCPIHVCDTLVEGLWQLQAAGYVVHGLVADGATDLFALAPAKHSVFVVGSETRGLGEAVQQTLDQTIAIPMRGEVESLNVAVAAALVCFATRV